LKKGGVENLIFENFEILEILEIWKFGNLKKKNYFFEGGLEIFKFLNFRNGGVGKF